MKSSADGANGAARPTKPNQLATVSERKLKANRENAKKSTGPKTPRGKALSRRNALKHGLFATQITDFEALSEDPNKYLELLKGLWNQYQPIGKAEAIEVERIAICFWRLRRAWRYENAANLAARRDFVRAELDEQEAYCKERDKEEEAILLLLQEAKKEIQEKGEISQELKQRIVALVPPFESLWKVQNQAALVQVFRVNPPRILKKLSLEQRSRLLAMQTVTNVISQFEELADRRYINVEEAARGKHAIPNSEVLDRLLRYETTIDRALNRALERLERLQRRRLRQPLLPPVSVHPTQ